MLYRINPATDKRYSKVESMKYLQILRPLQWIKNTFVFAALIFSKQLLVAEAISKSFGAFICFCLASSAVYVFNDIIDRGTDRLHPEKCRRPIATGSVTVGSAMVISVICALAAVLFSYILSPGFTLIILIYIVLVVLYSIWLKKIMILDCVVISIGFCLRAVAGAVVLGVFISPWLVICTFALCLFLAFSKRKSEITLLREDSEAFRATLAGYTPELLSHMLNVTSGLAIVCFLLYARDPGTVERFGTANLIYTTPLVLYCVFRFSALIQKGSFSGPDQIVLKDWPFQVGLVLWLVLCIGIIYADRLGIVSGGG